MRYFILALISFLFLLPENVKGQAVISAVDPQQEGDSLKLLSWNIYMLPPVVKFTGKRKRAKAIGDTLAQSNYDVLVLQEAFHAGARRKIHSRLKKAFPYRVGPAYRNFFSIKASSGVWILSRYPIKEMGKTKFKHKWGIDNKLARKGALMVEVDKNGQLFQIIGTHLNAGGPLDLRAGQLRQIRQDLIEPYHTPGVPLIIAGDFNIDKEEPHGLDSMMAILEVEDYEFDGEFKYTFDHSLNDLADGSTKGVIDYVYFRPEKLKVRQTRRFIPLFEKKWSSKHKSLADHNPVELLLYYRP